MAYTPPTTADFKTKYPQFANVPDATVDIWLDEGEIVCANYPESIRANAVMLYTAHMLTVNGATSATGSANVDGLTAFKSADFSINISEEAASRVGWSSTQFGREFARLTRIFFGGPIAAWTPGQPCA